MGKGRPVIDLTGQVFTRLTVVRQVGINSGGNALWLCLCECGTECVVPACRLKETRLHQGTKSCGCLRLLTHCQRGHEFTEENSYVDPSGSRKCRACKAEGAVNHKINNYEDIQVYQRDWNLKTKGWTAEKFDQAYKSQDEKCFICEKHIIARIFGSNMACADHIHTTPPKPRALLCMHCNTALGQLQDSPALLRKAADYIENFQ